MDRRSRIFVMFRLAYSPTYRSESCMSSVKVDPVITCESCCSTLHSRVQRASKYPSRRGSRYRPLLPDTRGEPTRHVMLATLKSNSPLAVEKRNGATCHPRPCMDPQLVTSTRVSWQESHSTAAYVCNLLRLSSVPIPSVAVFLSTTAPATFRDLAAGAGEPPPMDRNQYNSSVGRIIKQSYRGRPTGRKLKS